jgi:hypothetical protein
MHSTADRKTWISTIAPIAPRLELRHDRSVRTILDGAWWPRTRATVTELTNLITALDAQHLLINRIMLNTGSWDEHPRRISVAERSVRLGWFATLGASLLIATTNTGERVDLLVISPEVSATPAAQAMSMAVDDAKDLRADAIMAAVTQRAPRQRFTTPGSEAIWESEGGRVNGHRTGMPT